MEHNPTLSKNVPLITLAVTQLTTVVIGLLTAFGLDITAAQIGAIMLASSSAGSLLAFVLWMTTVSKKQVVEKLIGSTIVAGEANDMVPTGAVVRQIDAA